MFHQTHGFYVHGVSIETARLPDGWKERVIPLKDEYLTRGMTGFCIGIHDLAGSKIVAFREKDRDFIRILIIEGLIDDALLSDRIRTLPIEKGIIEHRLLWLRETVTDLMK
ncbi:MAG: hypothetical protein KAR44_11385 [Candidatus Aegiribacteria sp.]|nr:hypothetical protein [Candidatus Aegiribacteria sp.]